MPQLYESVVELLQSGEAGSMEGAKIYELVIGDFRRLVVAKDMFEAKRLLSCRKMSKSDLIAEAFRHTGRKPPLDSQLQLPLDPGSEVPAVPNV